MSRKSSRSMYAAFLTTVRPRMCLSGMHVLCRSSRVSYSEKKVVGGEDVEKKVAAALKDTARGMVLRGAARKHDALEVAGDARRA